jgi:hypothetical protein
MSKIVAEKDLFRVEEKVNTELLHIKEKINKIEEELDEPHICLQQERVSDIRLSVSENTKSIKKLYVWQASVGISLLIFFLTIGVAALRFVDKLDFAVQTNSKAIQKLESIIDSKNILIIDKDELKQLLEEALKK